MQSIQHWRAVLATLPLLAACGGERPAEQALSPDGIPIAYEVHGTGSPALVFVHGWSCDRGYWAGQLEPFSREHRVVAVDLAGHGASGLGREAWTMEAFGGDVAAVVEQLGLERVILIGHSMGGDVIVAAARQLPGRVAGLIWIDTYRRLTSPRTPEELRAMMTPFRSLDFVGTTRTFVRAMFPPTADSALVERVAMDMSAAPLTVALGALEHAMSFDREIPPALEELNLPVVAINADYQPTDVASLERHGVEVVIMPGVGHFLMLEDPERFNELLAGAVERLGR